MNGYWNDDEEDDDVDRCDECGARADHGYGCACEDW
jgi:hypothetical protein